MATTKKKGAGSILGTRKIKDVHGVPYLFYRIKKLYVPATKRYVYAIEFRRMGSKRLGMQRGEWRGAGVYKTLAEAKRVLKAIPTMRGHP